MMHATEARSLLGVEIKKRHVWVESHLPAQIKWAEALVRKSISTCQSGVEEAIPLSAFPCYQEESREADVRILLEALQSVLQAKGYEFRFSFLPYKQIRYHLHFGTPGSLGS